MSSKQNSAVRKDYKGQKYNGQDWHKWGMMHERPYTGQRKQRSLVFFVVVYLVVCLFVYSWTRCLNVKIGMEEGGGVGK